VGTSGLNKPNHYHLHRQLTEYLLYSLIWLFSLPSPLPLPPSSLPRSAASNRRNTSSTHLLATDTILHVLVRDFHQQRSSSSMPDILTSSSTLEAYPCLTRIHGKYYNLQNFTHPGGSLALACCYHRDATELFYSYHQFKNLSKIFLILQKYEVHFPPATTASSSDLSHDQDIDASRGIENNNAIIPSHQLFDWNESLSSEFYSDLMISLTPYFQTHGTKINSQRILELFLLFCFTVSQYFYFLTGKYFTLLTFPVSLFIFIANIAHDSSHFSLTKIHWLNDFISESILFIAPKYYWMYQHIIGHHCFTNIPGIDPDISISIYRHHPDLPFLPIHQYQPYFPLLVPVIRAPIFYLLSIWRCLKNKKFLGDHLLHDSPPLSRHSMITPTILLLFLIYLLPLLTIGFNLKGLLFSLLPYMIFNFYYMSVASLGHNLIPNHSQHHSNFFIHQVMTSHNFATQSYLTYLLSGALNFQIEHHLFPVSKFLLFPVDSSFTFFSFLVSE
jgi:fatty acid desaturase